MMLSYHNLVFSLDQVLCWHFVDTVAVADTSVFVPAPGSARCVADIQDFLPCLNSSFPLW